MSRDRYAETFRDVVAEESYRQWWNDPRSGALVARTLRSDMVFAVVPGPLPWTMFRDVFEVDGNAGLTGVAPGCLVRAAKGLGVARTAQF